MMTSDRQLPERAAKACAALRVTFESYSSLSWLRLYSASTSPRSKPLLRSESASWLSM